MLFILGIDGDLYRIVGVPTFREVVGSIDNLMGVKAVFGRSMASVMCFGSHGDGLGADANQFSLARNVAEKALLRPFLVSIGGGADVALDLRGKALELVRMTGAFGATKTVVLDKIYLEKLARWPAAVVASEIYTIHGEPSLKDDLSFPNLKILENAFDGVRRNSIEIQKLWEAIKDIEVRKRLDIAPPPGFRDPGKLQLFGSMYPRVHSTSLEGKKLWRTQKLLERDKKLSREAKLANRDANGGNLVCEGCDLQNSESAFFDAHHIDPLRSGERESRVDDFLVLCPNCHRWAHVFAPDKLQPLSKRELRSLKNLD